MRVAYINCLLSKAGALGIEKKLAAQSKAAAQLQLGLEVFYLNFRQDFHDGAISYRRLESGFPRETLLALCRYTSIPAHLPLDDYDLLLLRYSRADFSVFSRFFSRYRKKIVTEHHTMELPEAFTYRTTLLQKMTTLFMEKFLGPKMIRGCAGLIGVTDEIREYEIVRCGCPIPSCTVSNGVLVDEIPFSGRALYSGQVLNLLCLAHRFEAWHGLDRLLLGISKYRSRKPALHLRIVGKVPRIPSRLLSQLEHHPHVRVEFLGTLQGAALEEVFRVSHIAFSSLALFRMGMREACTLKTREFTARGIPFVIGYSDPDFKDGASEFLLRVPAENSPIDMEEIVPFAERVLRRNEIPPAMREFSEKRLDWTSKMQQVWDFLTSVHAGPGVTPGVIGHESVKNVVGKESMSAREFSPRPIKRTCAALERPPRVALSIRHYVPDGGGAETIAHRLAVRITECGVPITVLTGRYGKRSRMERIDGVPVSRLFIGVYLPVIHEVCYWMSLVQELIARRHEYDIIHLFQMQISALFAVALAKRMGKKVVVTCHSVGPNDDLSIWSSIPAGPRLLSYVCSHVDAATGVSRDVVSALRQAGFPRERTWYIPNGVSVLAPPVVDRASRRVRLGLDPQSLLVVFVGRLTTPKMPELLLDAWIVARQDYPDTRLVFIGDGDKLPLLREKSTKAGLEQAVCFPGWVENVSDYLNVADIFVLASASEGLPMAVLEAMAAGLPVVGSRISGIVHIVSHGENGLLFDPGNSGELARCLSTLMASQALRSRLGQEARRTVHERFSLDAVADRYLTLYRSL